MIRETKDSGVEWIGQIPTDWETVRTKTLFTNHKQIAGKDSPNYERLALTLNGVVKRSKDDSTGLQPEAFDGYQVLKPDELVFKLIDLENLQTSRVGLSSYEGIVSPAYIILVPDKEKVIPEYAEMYFLSMWYRAIFNHMGDDGVRSSLNANDLLNVPFILPSLREQTSISKFLKNKCNDIDKVIVDTQRSIDEYKKLEQSIITETVINGIKNNNKEIKYSGFEYIGDIPKYWRIAKVKTAFERKNKKAEQEDPIILSLARSGVRVRDISNNEGQLAESYYNYNPVEPGDLLLNPMDLVSGANCSISNVSGVISPAYINLKAKDGFNPRYYDYYFKIQYWSMSFFAHGRGVSFDNRWTLSVSDLFNYPIIVPPKEEQDEIAAYLDQKCGVIESIIEKKNAFIQNMNDYKKSIIYEYVTGKKEVPEL